MPVTSTDSAIKAGTVAHFAAATAPAGWIKANGAEVSRTAYAALFAAIGTTYGVGDGATTFNVPDLRGLFLRSLDDGRGVDSGRALNTWQDDDNRSHRHDFWYQRGAESNGNNSYVQDGYNYALEQSTLANRVASLSIGLQGTNESRPKNLAMLACIKY